MADIRTSQITPALPVSKPARVQPIRSESPGTTPSDPRAPRPSTVVATTGGSLRPAYAQFVTDPSTHETVVRIRDANTNAVISESPTPEVQATARALKAYLETMARHQAAIRVAASG